MKITEINYDCNEDGTCNPSDIPSDMVMNLSHMARANHLSDHQIEYLAGEYITKKTGFAHLGFNWRKM